MAGKVVKQLAGSGTGQSLSDMMTAMKHTLSGSLVAKVICKATTEEMNAPKRKHLAYLVQCTFEPRLSVPDFANYLVGRIQHNNLVVVFKALITIHHLMQYGHERFSQYIASNNCNFYSPSLEERGVLQAHGIGPFIRPYAKYLDEKAASYREVAYDLCRLKLGKEDGSIRNMSQSKLSKTLPVIEKQLDSLLAFDATYNELVNSVLRVAHLHLYRDLIRLYAVYNEAMINLIGRYFTMSKRDCRASLVTYKAFLKRMDSMNAFVKVAEAADCTGAPRSTDADSITFQPVPSSVLEALEQHLAYLEGNKSLEKTPSPNPSAGSGTPSGGLQPTSDPFRDADRTLGAVGDSQSGEFVLTDAERRRIIEEERARLDAFVTNARQRARSGAEADMRAAQDKLQQLSADTEFFADLLSDGEVNGTATSNAATGTCHAIIKSSQNAAGPWAQPSTSAWPDSTPTVSQPSGGGATSVLALLDFCEPLSPTSTTTTTTNTTTTMGHSSSSGFLSTPSTNNNPFVPMATASAGVVPPGAVVAFGSTGWPNPVPFQYQPFGMPVNRANGLKSQDPSHQEQAGPVSLDARLAQLAGNLSIASHTTTPASGNGVYRNPDGSLTAVNWSGRPSAPAATAPTTTTAAAVGSTVRGSASMNQLTTGPAVAPSLVSTNPWHQPATFGYGPIAPGMTAAGPSYALTPAGAVPFAYASGFPGGLAPQNSGYTPNPLVAGPTAAPAASHSLNPFL